MTWMCRKWKDSFSGKILKDRRRDLFFWEQFINTPFPPVTTNRLQWHALGRKKPPPVLGIGSHFCVRKWCKAKGTGASHLTAWKMLKSVITVLRSAQVLVHPSDLVYIFFPSPPLLCTGQSRTAELTGGSQITCKNMGECNVVCSFLLMAVGLALKLSLLQTSSIMRQNSSNRYSNYNCPVKFPFVLEEQLIFTGKQTPISGLHDWKNPHRKGRIILKYCGSVSLVVGFCFKSGYNSCNRLITSHSVPSEMCHQRKSAL